MILKVICNWINIISDTTEEITCEFEDIPNNVEESVHSETEIKDETKIKKQQWAEIKVQVA